MMYDHIEVQDQIAMFLGMPSHDVKYDIRKKGDIITIRYPDRHLDIKMPRKFQYKQVQEYIDWIRIQIQEQHPEILL